MAMKEGNMPLSIPSLVCLFWRFYSFNGDQIETQGGRPIRKSSTMKLTAKQSKSTMVGVRPHSISKVGSGSCQAFSSSSSTIGEISVSRNEKVGTSNLIPAGFDLLWKLLMFSQTFSSPYRASTTILFSIQHCEGLNVDVSYHYSNYRTKMNLTPRNGCSISRKQQPQVQS